MRAALQLFDQLEITYIPSSEARLRGPRSTCCGNIVERLIRSRGVEHATIVLRTIVESQGNESELIADIICAISDTVRVHPRWVGLGLQWLEAFDQISLAQIRKTAKATGAQPLRNAIMTLLCLKLEEILGPSKLPKPPARTQAEVMSDHLALGVALLKLKADEPDRFGAIAHERFKMNPKSAVVYRSMAAAKLYADRPEITGRISWAALRALSSPSTPPAVRRKLEAVIVSGQKVMVLHIERARKAHASRQQPDHPSARMAA
jgi:hypothetical protein